MSRVLDDSGEVRRSRRPGHGDRWQGQFRRRSDERASPLRGWPWRDASGLPCQRLPGWFAGALDGLEKRHKGPLFWRGPFAYLKKPGVQGAGRARNAATQLCRRTRAAISWPLGRPGLNDCEHRFGVRPARADDGHAHESALEPFSYADPVRVPVVPESTGGARLPRRQRSGLRGRESWGGT
jgi:hypothetical protein